MSERPYAIGRGRPPKHTQFRKGQSGNPAGRPKGSRNLQSEIRNELLSKVTARENGRTVQLTKVQLLIKTLFKEAVSSDMKAMALLLNLIGTMTEEEPVASDREAEVVEPEDAAIIAAFRRRCGTRGEAAHD